MKVGRVTLSDRAAGGVYEDLSGPKIERVIAAFFQEELDWSRLVLPDDREKIENALKHMADTERCVLIVTTGGTGPALRDVTPEATRAVVEKELPGFGETMRAQGFARVPTAILSRALAGVRGSSLILNLPGRPSAIGESLPPLLPAIAEALDHIAGYRPKIRNTPKLGDDTPSSP